MVEDQSQAPERPSPMAVLQAFPGAPDAARIEAWKMQAPAGRIQLVPLPGNRMFVVRGINGVEMKALQSTVMPNATDPEGEFRVKLAAHATLWTSITASHKLSEDDLRGAAAGLPTTLEAVITRLSDFYEPVELFMMVADL